MATQAIRFRLNCCVFTRPRQKSADTAAASGACRPAKKHIGIQAIEPVGNYAIRIVFDDGHDSGLFAWEFLEELGRDQERFFTDYLDEMKTANASRLPTIPVGHWKPSNS